MRFSVGWQAVEITTSADTQTHIVSNRTLCPPVWIPLGQTSGLWWRQKDRNLFRDKETSLQTRRRSRAWETRSSSENKGCSEGPTCVSLQFLNNLFGLKVPDVHHTVLRAWHDPLKPRDQRLKQQRPRHEVWQLAQTDLPSCDREVSEDAVLLILMAGVRLQTLKHQETDRSSDNWRETDRLLDRQGVPFLCCSPKASMCWNTQKTQLMHENSRWLRFPTFWRQHTEHQCNLTTEQV